MNSTEALSSLPASTTPQVPWQAAILVLFGAAANCMMQPAGRTCGASKKYTLYLRSSPLVCFGDALTLPMHLINDRWKKKLPVRESIKLIIQRRFNDEESDSQSSRLLGWAWTLFRWLFFVASHQPVAKFSVGSGVLWMRGWVGMYQLSFLITEILIIVSWCFTPLSGIPASLPTSSKDLPASSPSQPPSKESSTQDNPNPKSSKIDSETLYFATSSQVIFLLIILRDLWHPTTESKHFDHLSDSSCQVTGGLWFIILTVVTMSGLYGGPTALAKPSESESKKGEKGDSKKTYTLMYEIVFRCGMVVLEAGWIWALGRWIGYKVFIIDLLAWIVVAASVFGALVAIGGVMSPMLGERRMQKLALKKVVETKNGEDSDVDFGGMAAFLMMVYMGLVSVVWFVFVYGKEETSSP